MDLLYKSTWVAPRSFAVVRLATLVIVATMLLLGLSSARGASKFWNGTVSGNFSDGGNWVGGIAPAAGDDLFFQVGATRLIVTNNFSPNRAFNTLTFQGSNYVVRGNALLITNGISSINPNGPNTIDADVDVRASQPWEASGALATLDINGNIALNANTLTVRAQTGDFFFSGVVSGTGNLVKTNVGTLRLDGGANNTYSGFTRFDGGVLELDKFSGLNTFTAIPGDLTVGDGNGLLLTDVLRLLADNQIADISDVTVKNSALMDLNGHSETIGTLTMQGGTIQTGAGELMLGGNVTGLNDSNTAFINGNLSLGGSSRTFNIAAGAGPSMRVNGDISGGTTLLQTAGLTKTGAGVLWLAGTNTYNGTTTINDGQITISDERALGATANFFGAAGTVVNGDATLFMAAVSVTNENLTLNSTNTGYVVGANGTCGWVGDILINSNTIFSSANTLLLRGLISGPGGLTKFGAGSATLAGTNANTYTGTTWVRDGTLLMDKDTAVVLSGALSGPIIVGEDETPENTDILRWLGCCQVPDDTDITINASGLLDLNGFGQNVRNIVFNGGDLDAPSPGSILPTGDITVNRNTNSMAILSGRMSVLSNPIIDVTGHFYSPDLQISAQLFGAGGFTKNGIGEVALTASNSFTGAVTVNDGFVEVDDSFALGSTSGGTIVKPGAVVAVRFNSHVPAEPLTLAGEGQSNFGAVSSSFGSNSWAGNITLSSNATIYVDAGDFLNLSGAISGGFDVTKTGTGMLIFSGGSANDFGGMSVDAGILLLDKTIANGAGPGKLTIGDGSGSDIVRLNRDNQIADSTPVSIAVGGILDLNDMLDTTGSVGGRGQVDLGSGTLRAGADNGDAALAGLISGTGTLFKLGLGTWTLSGNNTYSGQTTVSAGTLAVNGSQPHSPVTVNGTGTLMGDGVVGHLDVFGNLRPGSSPAILTTSNFLFHSSSSDYYVELNGTTPGSGCDQLKVRGSVALSNATLHVSLGFQSALNNSFTIIDNDGADPVVNTFNGLSQGATVYGNGIPFQISYTGGSGNDVVLTQLAGPPALNISRSGETDVVLSWPTNFPGFTLQSNADLSGTSWTTVLPAPGVNGTNNVVTNSTSAAQNFYRLRNP